MNIRFIRSLGVVLALGILLTVSGQARNPRGFPAPIGVQYKFFAGDAAMSIQGQHNTPFAQAQADITALAAFPVPGGNSAQMYVAGWSWTSLESGTDNNLVSDAVNGTGQFAGFQQILAVYTYLESVIPGANFGFAVQAASTGNNYTASLITTRNWGTSGKIVPTDIATSGGSLAVPNSFGSGSTTTYPIAPIYSGSSYYGFAFSGWTGTVLTEGLPAYWNPGVNQRWINFWQALSLFQYVAPPGHPLAGQTLTFDIDPNFKYIFSNDEYSYAMLSGYNPTDAGGVTVNPPPFSNSANTPSNTNMFAAYTLWAQKVTSFFPHTLVGTCFSFGFEAAHGNDTPANMAAYTNQYIGGSSALSTIQGLALSNSDTYGTDFVSPPGPVATPALQGFIGISAPLQPTGLGPVTNTSLNGYTPIVRQVQPFDYGHDLPTGTAANSAAAVTAIAAAANNANTQTNLRIWWMGDGVTFSTTAWTTYVQPQIVAGVTPYSTVRPSNLP